MATTTNHSAFDSAPAFVKFNGTVGYKGTVASLREASQELAEHLGIGVRHALLDCVEEWCRDRQPTEPRPLCITRRVPEWTHFAVDVGVGDA